MKENLLAGSARHLELSGGLRALDYLMLNLPYTCNYRCTKCCNDREHIGNKPLSYGEITSLIEEAGARVLVIAGEGEPFMDRRIKTIIQKADSEGLIPYIFTNGSQLKGDMPHFLKTHNASLVVNIDSLQRGIYEELTGTTGSFDKLRENMEEVRRVFSDTYSAIGEYGLRRVAVNMVISLKNQGEAVDIREFCGDDFVFVCNTPMMIGRAHANPSFSDKIETPETIPLGTTSDQIWCAYMRNGISVGAGGEVLACAYSLESAGLLGNVRDGGIKVHLGVANAMVDRFYETNDHSRCILRHPDYAKFGRLGK